MINEKQVLSIYENILSIKKKVNISIECKRIAKIFDCNPKKIWDIVTKEEIPVVSEEAFREEEHPRDEGGKFTDKGSGSTGGSTEDDLPNPISAYTNPKSVEQEKIIEMRFGYSRVSIPKMAEFVNKNYPEWNMEIDDTLHVTKSKSYAGSRFRRTDGYTTKGFKITFTKNGKKVTTFDTSSKYYTNKDVALFISQDIMHWDYSTNTINHDLYKNKWYDRTLQNNGGGESKAIEEFKEEDHPRGGSNNAGQFTSKGGGGTTKTDDKKTKDKKTRIQTKTRRNTPKELTFGSDIVNKRNKIHDEVLKHYPNFNKEILLAEIEKSENEYEYVDYVRKTQHNKIEQIASYVGIEDFKVTSRVKDTLSAVEKIARKPNEYKTIDDLNDRVGCRLVLNSNEDVFKFVEIAKANFIVTEADDYITDGHTDDSGYRSYHLIIQDPDSKFTSEVQIRTKNQNKWADAFHLAYKPENSEMRDYKDEHFSELKSFACGLSSYYFAIDNGEEPPDPPKIPHALKVMGFDFETKLQEDEDYIEKYGKDHQPIKDLISSLGEADTTTMFDLIVAEVEEMTPDEGFNVCLFDDFAPHGEMLTLVGNYPDEETAQQIVSKCEEQGEIAYIYPSKVLYTEDDIEEDVDVKDLAKDLLEAEGNQEEMVD